MGLKCKVTYTADNKAIVKDNNGNDSKLYNDLLELYGNQKEALTAWATAYSYDMGWEGERSNYSDPRFQIIGERGAQKIERYKKLLDKARELEKKGLSLSDITDRTGWFKYKGDWRFFSNEALEQFKIDEDEITQGVEQKLSDILSPNNILFDMYPSLDTVKVTVSQDPNLPKGASYNEGRKAIETNLFQGRELTAAIAHEVSHFIQQREGLPQGGNYGLLLQQLVNELDFVPKDTPLTRYQVKDILNRNKTKDNKSIVEAALSLLDNNTDKAKYKIYRAIMGEMDAHMVTKAYTNRDTPYTYLELLDEELMEQGLSESDVIMIGIQGDVSFTPDPINSPTEVVQEVIAKLQETGLSTEVIQDNTEGLNKVLQDLGVSEEVRAQLDVWHGSPHLFDKFSTSAMGTGEGAQAFGWGLYFTDLESIARNYADNENLIERHLNEVYDFNIPDRFYQIPASQRTSKEDVIKYIDRQIEGFEQAGVQAQVRDWSKLKDAIEGFNVNVYEVSLFKEKDPSDYYFIEWDKAKGDYSNILKNYIESLKKEYPNSSDFFDAKFKEFREKVKDLDGKTFYEGLLLNTYRIGKPNASAKDVSLKLNEIGVDGIKYPAESISRGATSDTARGFNYVVFDENAVSIEEVVQFQKELSNKGVTATPNGFVHNGKVYLNTDNLNTETPIHEFGHLYNSWLKETSPEKYKKGIDLIKEELSKDDSEIQSAIDYVKETQPSLTGEKLHEEILAQVIGATGAEIINSKSNSSIAQWLSDVWSSIKDMLGLSTMSVEQVSNMTIGDYTRAVNRDLLGGNFRVKGATATDVVKFMDTIQAEESRLNQSEVYQVTDFMQKNGFSRLSDLYTEMVAVFKPNGYFEVDVNRAVDSGMYTKENLENLDVSRVSDILSKIEGQLYSGEVYVSPDTMEESYQNDNEFTVFGTNARYSEQDVFDSIRQSVSNPRNEDSFYAEIGKTGFSELEDKLKSNQRFARDLISRMSKPQSLTVLREDVDGNIVEGQSLTFETVKNTVLRGENLLELEADIEFIESIDADIWESNLDKVQEVVRDIEKSLIDHSLDIIGLSEITSDRTEILGVLNTAKNLLENPSDSNVLEFSELRDNIFGAETYNELFNTNERLENQSLLYLDTGKSAVELFNQYGLIKVANNVYHKVDQTADADLAIDIIAKSDLQIPSDYQVSTNANPQIKRLEDTTNYIMATSPRSLEGIDNTLLYASYLNYFGHTELGATAESTAMLEDVTHSMEYLTGEFVTEFYQEYLRGKFNSTPEYRDTLSKFRFTNSDITLASRIESIENIPLSEELADYIRIRKNSSMKYLVPNKVQANEDLVMVNNPDLISEYQGITSIKGPYAIIRGNLSDNFVKVNGTLYRKVLSDGDITAFLDVNTNENEAYLNSGTNFENDVDNAQAVVDQYKDNSNTALDANEYSDKISKARDSRIKDSALRDLSTLTDPSYSFLTEGDRVLAFKGGKKVAELNTKSYKAGIQVSDFEINQWDRGNGVETEMYLHLLDSNKSEVVYLNNTDFTSERYIAEGLGLPLVNGNYVFSDKSQYQVINQSGVPIDAAAAIYKQLELDKPDFVPNREVEFVLGRKKVKFNLQDVSVEANGSINAYEQNEFEIKAGGRVLGTIDVQFQDPTTVTVSLSKLKRGQLQDPTGFRRLVERIIELVNKALGKNVKVDRNSNAGKGVGKVAYENLAIRLMDDYGANLLSDTARSNASNSLWQSFERAGKAVVVDDPTGKSRYKFLMDNSQDKAGIIERVYREFKEKSGAEFSQENLRKFRRGEIGQETGVQKTSTIFQNAIEIVPLYTTKEASSITEQIDSCG